MCLIGASGSGKSTLPRCINALVQFDHGRILLDGVPINQTRDVPVRPTRTSRLASTTSANRCCVEPVPRHTTCFDDLATALLAWAKGLLAYEAAVELLIDHRWWLARDDFLVYVELCRDFHVELMAALDWRAAWAGLEDGHLPCSSRERQVIRVAASIAEGVPIDLRDAVSCWTRPAAFWWLALCWPREATTRPPTGEYHDAALAKYVECDASAAAGRATETRRPGTV